MKTIFLSILAFVAVSTLFPRQANAQQSVNDSLISILQAETDNNTTSIDLLNRLKITGYIQAQWQMADTAGINSFSGGNFPKTADNRFLIRRGRIKFMYDYSFSQFVLQLDATEKGVAIKDAYIAVMDPWANFVTLTAGVFDRPFGYEITYSSSTRETPERARSFQTLFPGERDLGAKITLQPKKGTRYDFIKLDAGFFAGNGINSETDNHKDFIGHLSFAKANKAQKFKYGGGISYYNGGVLQTTKKNYKMGTASEGANAFVLGDSTSINTYAKRTYYGADVQFSLQTGIGISTLRAEWLFGKQPGSASSTSSPTGLPTTDIYNRIFGAYYIYLIQNIGMSKHQLVIKYDWYDPNIKVSGNEIQKKYSLSSADVFYSTLGLGWNYRFNPQVKFTAYYEIVKNETTGITGANSTNNFTKDLKDNVLTLRVQYKF